MSASTARMEEALRRTRAMLRSYLFEGIDPYGQDVARLLDEIDAILPDNKPTTKETHG